MQTAISYGSTLEEFFSRILCFPLQIAPKEFVIIFFSLQVKNSSTFQTYPWGIKLLLDPACKGGVGEGGEGGEGGRGEERLLLIQ